MRAHVRWPGGELRTRTVQVVVGNGRYYGMAPQVAGEAPARFHLRPGALTVFVAAEKRDSWRPARVVSGAQSTKCRAADGWIRRGGGQRLLDKFGRRNRI